MVQDCTGSCKAVSDVLVLEGMDEHFIEGGEKNLSKSPISAVIHIEKCGGGAESIAKFGDLGTSGVVWDYGYRSGVDGHDKSDVR